MAVEVVVAAVTGSLASGGAVGVAFITAAKSKTADKETAEIQRKALDVDRNDRFVQRLLERLDQLEEDSATLSEVRKEHSRELKEIQQRHEREIEELRVRYETLYARVMREQLGTAAPPALAIDPDLD